MNLFPYSNFHDINQDWIMKKINEIITKIKTIKGIPPGGTTGQSLVKKSNTSYDVEWVSISGGDTKELYYCIFGTTTNAEIETALVKGLLPVCKYQNRMYYLTERISANQHLFNSVYRSNSYNMQVILDSWIPITEAFATTIYVNNQIAAIPPEVFVAEYEVTSYADLLSAYNDGKYIVMKRQDDPDFPDTTYAVFCGFESDTFYFYDMNPSTRMFSRYRRNATDWYIQNQGTLAITNSPNFTGIPTAPTAALGTNTTQIASTAFVQQEINNIPGVTPLYPYTGFPASLGTAFPGTSADYARGDHVHAKPSASDIGAIPAPSSPTAGQFLSWDGNNWIAASLPVYNGGVI